MNFRNILPKKLLVEVKNYLNRKKIKFNNLNL